MLDLNQFIKWVEEKDTRSVSVQIGKEVYNPVTGGFGIKIWVWDSKTIEGQHVMNVDEIDLDKEKERTERGVYERLKAKFEGAGNDA